MYSQKSLPLFNILDKYLKTIKITIHFLEVFFRVLEMFAHILKCSYGYPSLHDTRVKRPLTILLKSYTVYTQWIHYILSRH